MEESYSFWDSPGQRIRKEKRRFRRETATALAGAEMARVERRQVGETRRRRMTESGLIEKLAMGQEFARPLQTAEIGRLGAVAGKTRAETAREKYGLEFEKGLESTLEGIIGAQERLGAAKAAEAKLGVSEAKRGIRLRDEAKAREAARPLIPPPKVKVPPRSAERRMRPALKKFLWEGTETKIPGIRSPGLAAPLYGYKNIVDWLKYGIGKAREWAYPGTR